MEALPIFLNLKHQPVMLIGEGAARDAKARLLARAGARIVGEDDPKARIAIVAVDDAAEAEAIVARLKARGLIVNAVDRPALCDFTLPAIVDRAPVMLAVGTGGASASLAKALRQYLEALLPASLGALAAALRAGRAGIAEAYPEPADRRAFLDDLLQPGGALDPLEDHQDPAGLLARALETGAAASPPRLDSILLVSADPDALTLGAARLLARADTLYHQRDVPPAILSRARADAARILCDGPPAAAGPGRSVYLVMKGSR